MITKPLKKRQIEALRLAWLDDKISEAEDWHMIFDWPDALPLAPVVGNTPVCLGAQNS